MGAMKLKEPVRQDDSRPQGRRLGRAIVPVGSPTGEYPRPEGNSVTRRRHSPELSEAQPAEATSRPAGASLLELYLREAGQVKLLTPQEEIALAKRIQAGDNEARDLMIRANLRLVVKIARDYENMGVPLLDLINEGNVGLMKGVDRFDPTKGAKLSTYAAWWIKQAIKQALADQGKTIRLPSHVVEKVAHIRRADVHLRELLRRDPTEAELAEETDLTPKQVREYREAGKAPVSLETPLGDGDDPDTASAIVADERTEAPYERMVKESDTALMREAFALLKPREQDILSLRFGLENDSPMTLDQIGKRYGLTRERIRQIENEGLQRLRTGMARRDALTGEEVLTLAE
jgi:RNA polymerase primary sigma factor